MPADTFRIPGHEGMEFGSATVLLVRGQPGIGFYRVDITLKVNPRTIKEGERLAMVDLRLDISIDSKPLGIAVPTSGQNQISAWTHSSESGYALHIDITADQLAALERIRAGRDLQLQATPHAKFIRGTGEQVSGWDSGSQIVIAQTEWLAVLQQMGYQDTVVVEIPLPAPVGSLDMAKELADLMSARLAMLQGRWRDAIGQCRDCLELTLHRDAKGSLASLAAVAVQARQIAKREDQTQEQRLAIVADSVLQLTHLARHRKGTGALADWGPEDAATAVAVTALVMRLQALRERDASSSQP